MHTHSMVQGDSAEGVHGFVFMALFSISYLITVQQVLYGLWWVLIYYKLPLKKKILHPETNMAVIHYKSNMLQCITSTW